MALMPDREEQAERARAWEKERVRREKEKEEMGKVYGEKLGAALTDYKYLKSSEIQKRQELRDVFAGELARLFTTAGDTKLAVSALMEILGLIDTRVYDLEDEVNRMDWTGPY